MVKLRLIVSHRGPSRASTIRDIEKLKNTVLDMHEKSLSSKARQNPIRNGRDMAIFQMYYVYGKKICKNPIDNTWAKVTLLLQCICSFWLPLKIHVILWIRGSLWEKYISHTFSMGKNRLWLILIQEPSWVCQYYW